MEADELQEVLIAKTDNGIDTGRDDEPGGSSSHFRSAGLSSRDQSQSPSEAGSSARRDGDARGGRRVKSDRGSGGNAGLDECNNVGAAKIQPETPSTTEDGMPIMFPRDAEVLPTAILSTCCCPLCGCIAISQAKKARRLREAGKFHASAEATEASTRWACSAALAGCFILLGLALSAMIFLVMKYA